jgi:hypothetical protein
MPGLRAERSIRTISNWSERLLKQRAFALAIESKLPLSAYQALKPLLPEMFERIAYRAERQEDIVQSLNVIFDLLRRGHRSYLEALCREAKNGDLRVCYKREFRNARKRLRPNSAAPDTI